MSHEPSEPRLFGLIAEFTTEEQMLDAAARIRDAGYEKTDGYSPFPVHGLDEALGIPKNRVPLFVLLGGIIGGVGGFGMQAFANVYQYPLNIGGKPYFSWPAFIPITFEMTILFASLVGVVAMILMNGLPMHHHPLFNVREFERASRESFFLGIETRDPQFDEQKTRQFLEGLKPVKVYEVPNE
jgi:hypothetical protein